MDRINTLNKATDLFGVGKHGWKNRNAGLGVEPTEFSAEWCNGMQEELLNIIEAAGIAPIAATRNQVLLALRAAGVFATPAQFDNTTKAATTAFVKRQGLQSSDALILTGGATLTAADAGKTVIGGSGSPITVTLPLANSVPAGARLEFITMNGGAMTVQRQGADIINTSITRFSEVLSTGDSLSLVSNGNNQWYAVGGTNQLQYSGSFAANRAGVGYQRFPGGTILQWGIAVTGPSGNSAIVFPIAFPTLCTGFTFSISSPQPVGVVASSTNLAASGITVCASTLAGAAVNNAAIPWIATGY